MLKSQEIIIEPNRIERQYWRDLWTYRELFYFLAWRDILVRYKQTTIGIAWAILRPFFTMIVFSIVFGKLAKMPSGNIPYPILVFSAMLPWQFFSSAFSGCSNSMIGNAHLISKVYFPRLAIPFSTIMVCFVDFFISLSMLFALMVWYNFWPSWRLLFLPLFILLTVSTALGAGLWISALNVKYRDFSHVVPFIVQMGLYISPVGFSSDVIPMQYRLLYSINPMVGVIDGFRWVLLGKQTTIYWPGLLLSITIVILISICSLYYFRQTERTFADII